ncbi:MAG: type II 3-dehydroquinate dehydratase [Fidelibacterota bacterium]|nr:MAG: type II 3-dehydroquinate dehydratase [Candidatus Neomarinimicrobiota bacterium]
MQILVLYGPNLNLLGLVSRGDTRLTLDRLNQALRRKAQDLGVELKIFQKQGDAEASKIIQRQRNRVEGVLLIPGIWARTGHLIRETAAVAHLPLAVFHLEPLKGPWDYHKESIFKGLAVTEANGITPEDLADFLKSFVASLTS